MAISILGGKARAFSLKVPDSDLIRPMSVRLKRKIFDAFQNLEGVCFVDLCAGSGAVGIEAWSRGAERVFLSEKNKKIYKVTKSNIEELSRKFSKEIEKNSVQLVLKECQQFLVNFKQTYESFSLDQKENTIIFLAPPYPQHQIYFDVLSFLKVEAWFKGQLWVESDQQKGPLKQDLIQNSYDPIKQYIQGTTYLLVINY